MKRWALVLVVFAAVLVSVSGAFGATVTGTVDEDSRIVDDEGRVFVIGITPEGDEVMLHTGSRVQVVGEIFKDDEQDVIEVSSFKILDNGEIAADPEATESTGEYRETETGAESATEKQ